MVDQQYCVAAEDRETKVRDAITEPTTYEAALYQKNTLSKMKFYKKVYRYFHVAKYPYKPHINN